MSCGSAPGSVWTNSSLPFDNLSPSWGIVIRPIVGQHLSIPVLATVAEMKSPLQCPMADHAFAIATTGRFAAQDGKLCLIHF
jgi:hypothetical protein